MFSSGGKISSFDFILSSPRQTIPRSFRSGLYFNSFGENGAVHLLEKVMSSISFVKNNVDFTAHIFVDTNEFLGIISHIINDFGIFTISTSWSFPSRNFPYRFCPLTWQLVPSVSFETRNVLLKTLSESNFFRGIVADKMHNIACIGSPFQRIDFPLVCQSSFRIE